MGFSFDSYEGGGVYAKGLQLRFSETAENNASFRLQIKQLKLEDVADKLQNVELYCPKVELNWPKWRCEEGIVVVAQSPWGSQHAAISMDWQSVDAVNIQLSGIRYASGILGVTLNKAARNWHIQAKLKKSKLSALEPLQALLQKQSIKIDQGQLTASVDATLVGKQWHHLAANLQINHVNYSDNKGLKAAEGLALTLKLNARQRKKYWQGNVRLDIDKGELYHDPVFVSFNELPLYSTFEAKLKSHKQLNIDAYGIELGGKLSAKGHAKVSVIPFKIKQTDTYLNADDLFELYQLVQPLLIDTAAEELLVEGKAQARIKFDEARLTAIDLDLEHLTFDEQHGKFGINDLAGELHWRQKTPVKASKLHFKQAHHRKVEINCCVTLNAELSAVQAKLLTPLKLPFYEGDISISQLDWTPELSRMSLAANEISLEALTKALDWPSLKGRLNGKIPRVSYGHGSLDIEGGLTVNVFNGNLLVNGLKIEGLDKDFPLLQANIQLKNLDLAQLTEAFSFGKIEGNLNGDVKQIQLVNWQPINFDAYFYSPKDDERPHRISQKAIDNLTQIGNGVSGALSSTFLGIFKTFSYDRIDLKIKLTGDNARLGGIPASNGGFYLVKGSGLPRVDVIGQNNKIAWKSLLQRLQSVRFDGASVQ